VLPFQPPLSKFKTLTKGFFHSINEGIDEGIAKEIAKEKPLRVVFRDKKLKAN
jgi:hypothetical protein